MERSDDIDSILRQDESADTDDIDFVNTPADFDALVDQIVRCRRGTQIYVPLGSSDA